ncbi:MAG: trypsin-like peptidase domain-containing protein [Kiritimatiellae bacterium]|nr:trypsin-like peptidase domain-containing protein [Kiritimatiellia bacterium]
MSAFISSRLVSSLNLILIFTLLLEAFANAGTEGQSGGILDSLVTIEVRSKVGGGRGSGFVVDMDGKKYLVTNQHVIDCCDSINIRTLSNERIIPVSTEVSKSLDLIRMEITNNIPALRIKKDNPDIGDKITVYGNSDGGGVVTRIQGKVLGVGPNLVEVDAEFVQGNSGCPILSESLEVVGVASYATLFKDPEDWLSKDTRFQEVRRYGYRFAAAEWGSIEIKKFAEQSKLIVDAEQAIYMYAITYLLFRQYSNEPRLPSKPSKTRRVKEQYKDAYGIGHSRWITIPNENYPAEYQEWERMSEAWAAAWRRWEENNDRFRSVDPRTISFHYSKLEKKCVAYYKTASRQFFGGIKWSGSDIRRAQQGQLMTNRHSIDDLKSIKSTLSKKKFSSGFLSAQADELIEVCDYIIEFHQERIGLGVYY